MRNHQPSKEGDHMPELVPAESVAVDHDVWRFGLAVVDSAGHLVFGDVPVALVVFQVAVAERRLAPRVAWVLP
jgi:hypothetical protein